VADRSTEEQAQQSPVVLQVKSHSQVSVSQSLIRVDVSLESQIRGEPLSQVDHTEKSETRALKALQRDASSSFVLERVDRPSSPLSELVDVEHDVVYRLRLVAPG
jgi:hypothetical protein